MCARLLAALEELAAQEAASLAARDFAAVVHLQERAAPLVAHLAEHGPGVAKDDPALVGRIAAWLARRHETGEWLAGQIARTKEKLSEVEAAQRRVARVAPAYGRGAEVSRRLCEVG